MVVVLGGRELLDQLGVALQWGEVERGELPARERCALPDVFQQFLPAWRGQQRCGRLRPHRPFRSFDGGGGRCADGGWHPFALEQREHGEPRMTGCSGAPVGLFRIGPFPLAPFLCPFPALWPLSKAFGYRAAAARVPRCMRHGAIPASRKLRDVRQLWPKPVSRAADCAAKSSGRRLRKVSRLASFQRSAGSCAACWHCTSDQSGSARASPLRNCLCAVLSRCGSSRRILARASSSVSREQSTSVMPTKARSYSPAMSLSLPNSTSWGGRLWPAR